MSHKRLEFRRHAERGDGKGLSASGWRMARECGGALQPPYHLVISSPKRRCVETTRAMGFTHFLLDERFGPPDLGELESWDRKIRALRKEQRGMKWVEAVFRCAETRKLLQRQGTVTLDDVRSVLHFLPDGGRALVVSHGVLLEAVALHAFPEYEWRHLGKPFGHCEGFELECDGDRVVGIRILRHAGGGATTRTAVRPAGKRAAAGEGSRAAAV